MSERTPEEIWKVIEEQGKEDQALEDEIRAVMALSEEELKAELRAAGVDPAKVEKTAVELVKANPPGTGAAPAPASAPASASASAPLRVVERGGGGSTKGLGPGRRSRVPIWTAMAAAAAVVGLLLPGAGPVVVAWWNGGPQPAPGPSHIEGPPKPPQLTPVEQAALLRKEGLAACDEAQWLLCQQKLEEARKLDPQGDGTEIMFLAYQAIYQGLHPDAGYAKEVPAPGPAPRPKPVPKPQGSAAP
jgi:hypothetical protein